VQQPDTNHWKYDGTSYSTKLAQPIASATLTAPTIADLTNATHTHLAAASGGALVNTGSYTGNNTTQRAIAHGLSVAPKIVIIHDLLNNTIETIISTSIVTASGVYADETATTADATNFYVGGNGGVNYPGNLNPQSYIWCAIA